MKEYKLELEVDLLARLSAVGMSYLMMAFMNCSDSK